ncbi:DUF6082 family protein [Streptomyces sp. NPDC001663]|uniref:DUF6082 family protein n=1 Tax=Streptomyces sp. NPDC001663 TaxID=3364597 RepID=UPI00367563B8
MAYQGHVRRVWSLIGVGTVSCVGSIALTLALVHVPGLQSSASGNAGQAFGAAAACASFFVLLYAARSFHQQAEEFRMRRVEMAAQCEELRANREDARLGHESAFRAAEASVRGQHVMLTRMAIEDADLSAVWPGYGAEFDPVRTKQYRYANLIISFQCMSYQLKYNTDDEVLELMQHLFSSPVIHDFWAETRETRNRVTPYGGSMRKFYELAELAFQQYAGTE